jgi:hypothetical protein
VINPEPAEPPRTKRRRRRRLVSRAPLATFRHLGGRRSLQTDRKQLQPRPNGGRRANSIHVVVQAYCTHGFLQASMGLACLVRSVPTRWSQHSREQSAVCSTQAQYAARGLREPHNDQHASKSAIMALTVFAILTRCAQILVPSLPPTLLPASSLSHPQTSGMLYILSSPTVHAV